MPRRVRSLPVVLVLSAKSCNADGLTLARLGQETEFMNNIIYIVGLIVVIAAVLSFFGLR